MKNSVYHLLFAAGIIGMFIFLRKDDIPEKQTKETATPEQVEIKSNVAQFHEQPPEEDKFSKEIQELHRFIPDKREMKDEIKKNPHRTPEGLIEFAMKLGPLYGDAIEDPEKAMLLSSELSNCSKDESFASSARALCLSRLDMLMEKFPHLKDEYSGTHEETSSEVEELVNRKNQFLNK